MWKTFSRIQEFLKVNEFTHQFEKVAKKHFKNLVKDCLTHNANSIKPKALWYGDVTPWYLDIDAYIIHKDAPYIIINRDGRDILVSQIYHRLRHISRGNSSEEFERLISDYPSLQEKSKVLKQDNNFFDKNPTQLLNDEVYVKNAMARWSDHVNALSRWYSRLSSDFKDVRVHPIRYEDLHSNFTEEKNRLYRFLNLDPREAQKVGNLESPGFEEVDNLSHYRKGIVGDWSNYFTEEVCQWVKEVAGDALIEAGYEKDLNWSHGFGGPKDI